MALSRARPKFQHPAEPLVLFWSVLGQGAGVHGRVRRSKNAHKRASVSKIRLGPKTDFEPTADFGPESDLGSTYKSVQKYNKFRANIRFWARATLWAICSFGVQFRFLPSSAFGPKIKFRNNIRTWAKSECALEPAFCLQILGQDRILDPSHMLGPHTGQVKTRQATPNHQNLLGKPVGTYPHTA